MQSAAPQSTLSPRRIAITGILAAVAILLGWTRIGFIPVPNLSGNATIMHVPAIIGGGSNKTPQWNVVDGSQRACGTCHGFPPPAPHLQLTYCTGCHPDTVNEDGSINLTTGYHINGVIDAPF